MRTFWQVADTLSALGTFPSPGKGLGAWRSVLHLPGQSGVCGKMFSPGGRKVGSLGIKAGVSFPRVKTSSYTLLLHCPCGATAMT